jgi:hypothetical protein
MSVMFRTLLLLALAAPLAASAAVAPPVVRSQSGSATGTPRSPEVLAPENLVPGQKAIVRTVFQGSRVEEFEAEIVGVLKGGRAEGDIILARAVSERVQKSGVAQGMSGSPVYVDGKLIGALSSGWPFSREPVFGITPIGDMLGVLDHREPTSVEATAGPTGVEVGTSAGVRFGMFRWDDLDDTPGSSAPDAAPASGLSANPLAAGRGTRMSALPLPLACSGLTPFALDITRRWLEPLGFSAVPGGRAAGDGPPAQSLEPGSAVAVDLMRGDLQMAAIGTVTWREGDRVLLFGHPFFQTGNVRLPMATAEITTVIASDLFSFKLGARGRSAGVVTQDRRAALAGQIGGEPRMLPVSVTVSGEGRGLQAFHFESIEDRTLVPNLIGVATLNSLLESGGLGANQTVRWVAKLYRAGAPPLTLSDVEAGETPAMDAASSVASPLNFLFNNPFKRLSLDSVSVALEVMPGREQWTLRSARVLEAAVRPGRDLTVQCDVERWRGGRETRTFRIPVPEELPDGKYVLWLGGGPELSRYEAQHLPGRYRPTSLDDAWHRLASVRSSDGLYASVLARAPEVTLDGRDYPELPTSALALLSSDQEAGDRSRRGDLAKLGEQRLPLEGLVRGELQVAIQVDSKTP